MALNRIAFGFHEVRPGSLAGFWIALGSIVFYRVFMYIIHWNWGSIWTTLPAVFSSKNPILGRFQFVHVHFSFGWVHVEQLWSTFSLPSFTQFSSWFNWSLLSSLDDVSSLWSNETIFSALTGESWRAVHRRPTRTCFFFFFSCLLDDHSLDALPIVMERRRRPRWRCRPRWRAHNERVDPFDGDIVSFFCRTSHNGRFVSLPLLPSFTEFFIEPCRTIWMAFSYIERCCIRVFGGSRSFLLTFTEFYWVLPSYTEFYRFFRRAPPNDSNCIAFSRL